MNSCRTNPSVGAHLVRDGSWLSQSGQSRARRAPAVHSLREHELKYRTIRRSHSQAGVTLIELVITIVIISVAIAGVLGAFATISERSADPLVQSRATALAQLYLDEIMARQYEESTPLGGGRAEGEVECSPNDSNIEDRDDFQAVNDFHTGEGNFQAPSLAEQSDELYSGYEIQILVSCAGGEFSDLGDSEAKRIDVTVQDPRGRETTLSVYRGNF